MDGAGASAQSSLVRSLEGRLGALFAREAVSNQTKLVSTLFFSLSPDTTPPLRSFGSSTTHAPLKKEKTGEKSERKRGKSARAFYRPSSPRFELENKKKVIWFSSTCAFFFFLQPGVGEEEKSTPPQGRDVHIPAYDENDHPSSATAARPETSTLLSLGSGLAVSSPPRALSCLARNGGRGGSSPASRRSCVSRPSRRDSHSGARTACAEPVAGSCRLLLEVFF